MGAKRFQHPNGLTLIEVMVAILILSVALVGASGYRYYSALDARKATMRSTAARIGLLLCESWRGIKGSDTYDPTAHLSSDLTISTITIPSQLEYPSFTLLGGYTIALDNANYYAILSWQDVDVGLRALNIVILWAPRDQETTGIASAYKAFEITSYTQS